LYQWLGASGIGIGLLSALSASVAAARKAGVPEVLDGIRGSGWTVACIGILWLGFASLKLARTKNS
jgi:hypothetical protein